jgi:hypothetical protein
MLALKLLHIGGQFYSLKEIVSESHPESKDHLCVALVRSTNCAVLKLMSLSKILVMLHVWSDCR